MPRLSSPGLCASTCLTPISKNSHAMPPNATSWCTRSNCRNRNHARVASTQSRYHKNLDPLAAIRGGLSPRISGKPTTPQEKKGELYETFKVLRTDGSLG